VIISALIFLLYLDHPEIEGHAIATLIQLHESSEEQVADTIMKNEQTCNIGIGERSLWQWICERSNNIMQDPNKAQNIERLLSIVKIIPRMLSGDPSNSDYLLNMGILEFLINLMQWNNT
jgi:hypothetical protein